MKNLILTLFLLVNINLVAQTDGISYQAVIIGPDNQELPGVDAEGNILPNTTISIRFTILLEQIAEYQEEQTTNTDQYGRINLLIGQVDSISFKQIDWDGRSRYLKVEIDFEGGTNYVDMSREKLTYLPYSKHRNITASGTLTVDDRTYLNGELQVQGPTNLNSTLNVNGGNATNLSGELNVDGTTSLNNTLNVNNMFMTKLSGALNVGNTTIDEIDYNAPTNLAGILNVNGLGTFKNGISVKGTSTFDNLNVTNNTILGTVLDDGSITSTTDIIGKTDIFGQVTIKPEIDNQDIAAILPINDEEGNQSNYNKYPLKVEGSYQGIAIKVKETRGRTNNYISFWDGENQMWGRIEGMTIDQLLLDEEFIVDRFERSAGIVISGTEFLISLLYVTQASIDVIAAFTSSTACVGLGACITTPIGSFILAGGIGLIGEIANSVLIAANFVIQSGLLGAYDGIALANIGVSYQSGAGDYAEWLPKQNIADVFAPGELVGINNGLVTKNVWNAEKVMVVSTNPIVLGNMPQRNEEKNNVKIAFMGQVPVRVLGKVEPGDYILPNITGSGFAKAVHPKDMKTRDFKKAVGVAWSIIDKVTEEFNIVNVAVGINTNDLTNIVYQQEEELKKLQTLTEELWLQIKLSNTVLSELVPGYAKSIGISDKTEWIKVKEDLETKDIEKDQNINEDSIIYTDENDIIYFQASRKLVENAIEVAREKYIQVIDDQKHNINLFAGNNPEASKILEENQLPSIQEHPFWQKIDNDPAYKEGIIEYVLSSMEKAYHTHKNNAHKFTDMVLKQN
ncbi:hypothetical protein JYT76_03795 [Olleya sp. AH-315-F22]|nr:hypothetical protein [Olleya sp. AH-315-F22]